MNTYSITFTDFTGHFWKENWTPDENLASDLDIQEVENYIKTGSWSASATVAAKKCYDVLAEHITDTIIEEAVNNSDHGYQIINKLVTSYVNGSLSSRSMLLFERLDNLPTDSINEDVVLRTRKLVKRIIKNDNIFEVKFDDGSAWRNEVYAEGMKCCICGTPITDREGHDPYPVRPESWYGEKENRCCKKCNYQIVVPARFRFGRHAPNHRDALMKMNYDELISFVA